MKTLWNAQREVLRWVLLGALLLGSLASVGCSAEDSTGSVGELPTDNFEPAPEPEEGPDLGVSEGGAQDAGLFRALLEAGEVPAPETLDDLGFFAEHVVSFPPADCGEDICIHGLLGVGGNLVNGNNCTLVMIGMNTPLEVGDLPRPPLNLVVAVDTSNKAGQHLEQVRQGLLQMRDSLDEKDRVTLITYDLTARVLLENVAPDDMTLERIATLLRGSDQPSTGTNLYDGLRLAYDTAERLSTEEEQESRVVLISASEPTLGIRHPERIVGAAEAFSQKGIGLTVVSLGFDVNIELLRSLGETGTGNFYHLEDSAAVSEVFLEELQTSLYPLAGDVKIQVDSGQNYLVRGIFGTRRGEVQGLRTATTSIPALFVAQRRAANDDARGRRGGGGAIIVELVPVTEPDAETMVGNVTLSYLIPGTAERVVQTVEIDSTLQAGETPMDGLFENETAEKGFLMLNFYAAFVQASERAASGDFTSAIAILRALRGNLELWESVRTLDEDIQDDKQLLIQFEQNLVNGSATAFDEVEGELEDPWPYD